MSFNLTILRLKIMFYLLLGKIRKNRPQIKFPNHKKIKRVIIFFPIDEDLFRLSLYSLRKFDFHKNNIEYYFVINQSFQNIINLNGINLFFVNYKKNKMTFCNLEEQDYLINNGSDVAIDLNLDFYLSLSRFIACIESNIKIGFKSTFSDYFYNLQLEVKQSGIVENSYKKIEKILKSL